LQAAVINGMNALLESACAQAGRPIEDVYLLAAAGNTCMHHLLLGLSPASLVTAPYNALLRHALRLEAGPLGLRANPRARLLMLPCIAGFVGADTVAGLAATSLAESESLTLLIDIGTNGELVLGDRRGRVACSTAAGPAFEGAMIHCGMRGAEGAIDHARLENGALSYSVIGGGAPRGICGSGLVDIVAALLDAGVIDESGRLCGAPGFERAMTTCDGKAAFRIEGEILLTQRDIRELQLAKAAMAAGIRLLCAERGAAVEDIRRVLIAGAFGNYLNAVSACRIGLLPRALLDRVEGVGNAAGEGVKRALRQPALWRTIDELAFHTQFLELATRADFQDCFVDEMNFPEADA
ncbi:MAG: ASKHA domain-containing protein, partial [Clostridia bacterium]|nr:ASKHA domain-containing protein [Clostridia bacterium]